VQRFLSASAAVQPRKRLHQRVNIPVDETVKVAAQGRYLRDYNTTLIGERAPLQLPPPQAMRSKQSFAHLRGA
jgi:hypothetical protein